MFYSSLDHLLHEFLVLVAHVQVSPMYVHASGSGAYNFVCVFECVRILVCYSKGFDKSAHFNTHQVRIQRGGQGVRTPLENHKLYGFL